MSNETINSAKNILSYIESIKTLDNQLDILKKIKVLTPDQKKQITDLSLKRKELLAKIENENAVIFRIINPPQLNIPKNQQIVSPVPKPQNLQKIPVPTILPKPQLVLPKQREIPQIALPEQLPKSF